MKKTGRLDMRISEYHESLLEQMKVKTDSDKSKLVREAIEYYANYVLGQDEVNNLRMYKHFGN